MKVAVLGATSKTGRPLLARLCDDGHAVFALGRSAARLAGLDSRAVPRRVDLTDAEGLRAALADADTIVSLAHARFTAGLLEAAPSRCERLVLTGSVRKYSALHDPAAEAVRAGEAAFLASGRTGVMLHPSMIYGAPEDRNVGRVLRLLRRWPAALPIVVPLPQAGRATVQPVFVDDVVAAVVGALTRAEAVGSSVDVVGPHPISYAQMIETCADALGRRATVIPFPGAAALVSLAGLAGIRLPFDAAELRRAGESKRFDPAPMHERLGVSPRPFDVGVREKLAREAAAAP
jgi:nucleoside-diphosphate-sugar epimerase